MTVRTIFPRWFARTPLGARHGHRGCRGIGLGLLRLKPVLVRCMLHATCVAVRKLDCTQMGEFALPIGACASIEPEAQSLVAVLEAQVLHCFRQHGCFFVVLEVFRAGQCIGLSFVALAFAFGPFVDDGRLGPCLQQPVHVAAHLSEPVHGFVQSPVRCLMSVR